MGKVIWWVFVLSKNEMLEVQTLIDHDEVVVALIFGIAFGLWFCQVLTDSKLNHWPDKM
ncbi:MAG: hypothetical protein ACJASP_002252 [Roseivirga sp.]|jgi:hypothetical protein